MKIWIRINVKDELVEFMAELWVHLEEQFINGPDWLPKWVQEDISQVGLDAFLQLTAWATEDYTPSTTFLDIQIFQVIGSKNCKVLLMVSTPVQLRTLICCI
jgi:hypothetical protein